MVLLTIVASLAIPSLGMMDTRGGLETAAARIKGAVYETRTRAMLARRTAQLRFADGAMRMVLRAEDGEKEELIGSAKLPKGVRVLAIRVEGTDERTDVRTLTFHPRGLTLPAVVQIGQVDEGPRKDQALTLFIPPMTDASVHDGRVSLETAKLEYEP